MGSGKLIKQSIHDYGVHNHIKEILGVFDNRQESLELEHALVKNYKMNNDTHLLNLTTGGSSFDYINKNLTFDRSAFGKMASHHYTKDLNKNIYLKSPKYCKCCKGIIEYSKRRNDFCSSSCSATYNNIHRSGYKQSTRQCLYCGTEFTVMQCLKKKFCNNSCASRYYISKKSANN